MSPPPRPIREALHLRLAPPPDEPGRIRALRRRVDTALTTVRRTVETRPRTAVTALRRTAPPLPTRSTGALPAQTTPRAVEESMRRHPSAGAVDPPPPTGTTPAPPDVPGGHL